MKKFYSLFLMFLMVMFLCLLVYGLYLLAHWLGFVSLGVIGYSVTATIAQNIN